jgi:hypothetical protein
MPYLAVNGLSMYYEAHGDGLPLLLLHGGSSTVPEKWTYWSDGLGGLHPYCPECAQREFGAGK